MLALILFGLTLPGVAGEPPADCTRGAVQISGIYPHLAAFNSPASGECGIGAVVPWADRLWMITYPPHATTGSSDKLYQIAADLTACIRPESVGGTHACRMIHRESNQLIIGPYFIDARGKVRAANLKELRGRMTAVMRHLTDPANKVYFFDMEGAIYEVDVHTLAVNRLFEKPVPGWHGKGGYTSQGRVVIANNGEFGVGKKKHVYLAGGEAASPDEAGILAEWDGRTWRVVERKQFTDVTGPGGICGAPSDQSPLWAIGWDRRSVILKLLDGGRWSTYRLAKASHCYDPRHGWYTEWPRIREVTGGRWLLDMHGMFYRFPPTFSARDTSGISALASHLRYIPDFCAWKDRLILAADDASIMQNPMVGQSQSNLWFGRWEDLAGFGPRSGWGGPWQDDAVRAGEPSDPFLLSGFDRSVLHLSHNAAADVKFTIEADRTGRGDWRRLAEVTVPARSYRYYLFEPKADLGWVRLTAGSDCKATAYFHGTSLRDGSRDKPARLAALATLDDGPRTCAGLIRPARHNRNLQFVPLSVRDGSPAGYFEVDMAMRFSSPAASRSGEVQEVAKIRRDFELDDASVIMSQSGKRYRLPRGDARYDRPFAQGWPRGIRECVSERFLMNIHGTFYEMPRDAGLPWIKPVATHGRQIFDFCTWRGLMVASGVRQGAKPDGNCFTAADGSAGLWFGTIDDLWQLGKPRGRGGPWLRTAVAAGEPSDPYLMTGYDRKRITLSHDADRPVRFTIGVDFDHRGWHVYRQIEVPAGKTVEHVFPEGFSAHWVRTAVDRACHATAQLTYE